MAQSEKVEQYASLHKKLALLIEQGDEGSEDANHLRDVMNALWSSFTYLEVVEARALHLSELK